MSLNAAVINNNNNNTVNNSSNTAAAAAAIFTATADRVLIDRRDANHVPYGSWCQRYSYRMCYFCTYGFYCPFEEDLCCVCGIWQEKNADYSGDEEEQEEDTTVRHFASTVKESERLS